MSEGNGYCSLQEFTTKRAPPEKDVDVPGLGKFRIRGFTVSQRTRFENRVRGAKSDDARALLLVETIVKPEGVTYAHIKAIGDQDALTLEPLVEEALALTKVMESAAARLAKNSEVTASADSTSS